MRWTLALAVALVAAWPCLADGMRIEGSELVLEAGSLVVRGADLLGAVLDVQLEDGSSAQVRIDHAQIDQSAQAARPVWLYEMSVEDEGRWSAVCEPDREGRPAAILQPSGGRIAILCAAGALAKCMRFGYPPWAVAGQTALEPYWQACVHMVRGDYCGDAATTRDNMLIDYWDRIGIETPANAAGLAFEAGWGPQGAVCVAHTRVPQNMTLTRLAQSCPRLAGALGPSCTEAAARAQGALVFNASRGDGIPEKN